MCFKSWEFILEPLYILSWLSSSFTSFCIFIWLWSRVHNISGRFFLYNSKSIILQIKFDKQQQTMLFYEPFSRSEETPKEIKMIIIFKWGVDHYLNLKSTENATENLRAKFKRNGKLTRIFYNLCIVDYYLLLCLLIITIIINHMFFEKVKLDNIFADLKLNFLQYLWGFIGF